MTMRKASGLGTIVLSAAAGLCAIAATRATAAETGTRGEGPAAGPLDWQPVIQVPLIETAPTIDGDLSDAVWQKASAVMGLRFLSGVPALPTQKTEVRLAATTRALYAAVRCHEAQIDGLHSQSGKKKGPRDTSIWEDDTVDLTFKPGPSPEGRYYNFSVNAFGTMLDAFDGDARWNAPGFRAEVKRQAAGWTVEMEVPFADLRLPAGKAAPAGAWRLNLFRMRPGGQGSPMEKTAWSPTNNEVYSFDPEMFGYAHLAAFGGNAAVERPTAGEVPYPADPPHCRARRAPARPEAVEDRTGVEAGFGMREAFAAAGGYKRYRLDDPRAAVIDVNKKSPVSLPFSGGGIEQVYGLAVSVDAEGKFTAPDRVCCMIFRKDGAHAVVRVWENKAHRYFVSLDGADTNPGTEERPFRTIAHAATTVAGKDPAGDLYVAGGDYVGDPSANPRFEVSIYGGFDRRGWLRDPIIHEPVLLPQGFRENWADDMCERFKDLRRPDHRYHETRIWPVVVDGEKGRKVLRGTLEVGGRSGHGKNGSAGTFVDGVSVFGCPETGPYQPGFFSVTSERTTLNCILVMFWSNGHAFLPSPGSARGENNIVWGGIVGRQGHARPQMVYKGQHFRRNLFVGATGGDYTRMFLMWYDGGLVEENQIHGGDSFGWSTAMQGGHGAQRVEHDHTFVNNLVQTDFITHGFTAAGMVCRGNRFHVMTRGFTTLLTTRTLRVTDNLFELAAPVEKSDLFPTGDRMTEKVGGQPPTISGNRVVEAPSTGRRPPECVNAKALSWLVFRQGEQAAIRPKHPATDLKAAPAGPGAVRLSWTHGKDPDVAGYRIRFGTRPASWANNEVVGNVTSATIKDLSPGEWYFTVAAHKKAYVECWTLSNEAAVTVK